MTKEEVVQEIFDVMRLSIYERHKKERVYDILKRFEKEIKSEVDANGR